MIEIGPNLMEAIKALAGAAVGICLVYFIYKLFSAR